MIQTIENIGISGYVIAATEGEGTNLHVLRFWKSNKSDFGEWKDADKLSEATVYQTLKKAEIAFRRENGYLRLAMHQLKESLKDTFPDVQFHVMCYAGKVNLTRLVSYVQVN